MFLDNKLQPRTIGQIFDQAVKIYRRNFLKFLGLMVVPVALSALISVPITLMSADPVQLQPYGDSAGFLTIAAGILSTIVLYIAYAGVIKVSMEDYFYGETSSIMEAYQQTLGPATRFALSFLLSVILGGIVIVAFIIPCIGWLAAIPGLGAVMYTFTVIIPMTLVVMLAEKTRFRNSFERTWQLARREFWWVFGFVLLMTLFIQIVSAGPSFLLGLLGASNPIEPNLTIIVVQNVVSALLTAISGPLQMICLFLLYLDLRIKTEGLDIAILSAEETGESIESILMNYPVKANDRVSGTELGYFSLITLGWVAIGVVFVGFFALLGFGAASIFGGL